DFSRYTFHEALNPAMTTAALGEYVFEKGMKIALLTADYANGHEMTNGNTRSAEKTGAQIIGELSHPLGASDYSTFLPRLAALKPDILIFNNFGRDNQVSIKQASDFGLKRSIKFITPILTYTSRVAGGPNAYDGVVGATSYFWEIEDTVPSARAFNEL